MSVAPSSIPVLFDAERGVFNVKINEAEYNTVFPQEDRWYVYPDMVNGYSLADAIMIASRKDDDDEAAA